MNNNGRISVTDRLPKRYETVLAYNCLWERPIIAFMRDDDEFTNGTLVFTVTHWQARACNMAEIARIIVDILKIFVLAILAATVIASALAPVILALRTDNLSWLWWGGLFPVFLAAFLYMAYFIGGRKMKKLIAIILLMCFLPLLSGAARADYAPYTDYLAQMEVAAVVGDTEAGLAFEAKRNSKIAELGLDYQQISYKDLYLLSKIIYAEAGSEWLSDDWKMADGEVVLNRVASPEFPDTIEEVVHQPGQYYGANSRYFEELRPSLRCVLIAARLLDGERILDDPSVVFQANFKQGSGTHTALYDKYLGWTYFCYSSRPELYGEG